MAFEEFSEKLNESGDKAQEFVTNTAEYYKLRLFRSSMKFATSLIDMLAIGSFLLLFLAFVSIGFALLIGSAIGSWVGGFFILGGIYLLLAILTGIFGKKLIVKALLQKFSELVMDDDEQEFKSEPESETKLPEPSKIEYNE